MRALLIGLAAVLAGLVAPAASMADLPDLDARGGPDVTHAGRNDGLLTGPSNATPEQVALDHFRLDGQGLKLVARSVSPDGITHLRFNQVLDGIESYDSGLQAHVTRDGRLISATDSVVRGARLRDTTPAVSALAGLGEARRATRGLALPPRVAKRGAAATTFATGEAAALRWIATEDGPRLAWDVYAEGAGDASFSVVVDAESGETLVRTGLTDQLGQARYFPVDPDRSPAAQITMPPEWYDQHAGGTRLWGQYARTYVDTNNENPAAGAEQGGARVQIPASGGAPNGPDWLYTRSTAFPGATPCPPSGCSWNSTLDATRATNQFQVATNVHVLVGRFLEHLARPPISFDEASGTFRRTNLSGAGGGNDYVRVEVNDSGDLNNANFSTPPDGASPRMQTYFGTIRDVNFGDVAAVVYHEVGHGLSNRLVVNASGAGALGAGQPNMMGEAWSDFYAVDLLVHEGLMTDTAATGELAIAEHIVGADGIRRKPLDCPVNAAGADRCNRNGTATVILGGYTYGDMKDMNLITPHNGGELWAATLWDLRNAVGRDAALALITGGMRLTPPNPSMLDARDAILRQALAMRSAPDAPDDHFTEAWEAFRGRGMGFDATTTGPADTSPVEGFSAPRNVLYVRAPILSDPYPGGDNDGRAEPGERVEVSVPVSSAGLTDVSGVTGTLTSPAATIEDSSAAWPLLGKGRTAANSDPLVARMPAGCLANAPLTVTVTSPDGTFDATSTVNLRRSSRTVVPIADPPGGETRVTEATFEVAGGGTITDVNARIDELRHTYLGDLRIELLHAGETVTLFDPPDSLEADDMLGVVFDSDSLTPVFNAGAGPATGTMRPQNATGLNRFDGKPASGVWTLRITDSGPGDTGVLREWGVHGPVAEFPCPRLEIPSATTGTAGERTSTSATLHGAVDPNGRATGLRFAWGTTSAYGQTTATQDAGAGDDAIARTAGLTGLAPGTAYHYRVEAIREGGAVAVSGADQTFTTPAASVPAPTGAAPRPAGDRTAPTFAGRPKVKLAKAGKQNRRATFSFSLSEPARVTAAVTVAAKGIRKGSKCVAVPKRKPKGAKACTRQASAARGSATLAKAGSGTLALPKKGLGKGRYTAVLTAIDAAGNQSTATVTFTLR